MLVAPVPVILLIALFEVGKIAVFAMVLFCIETIRLIFLTVPCMVVIVLFIVIGASGLLILGSQHSRRHCYWGHQGRTQQGGTPETGHGLFYSPITAMEQSWGQAFRRRRQRTQRTENKDDVLAEWPSRTRRDKVRDMRRMTSCYG